MQTYYRKAVYSSSIDEAYRNYAAIRTTINLARELDFYIRDHYVKLTKRGNISQHNFIIAGDAPGKWQVMSNQILKGMLRTFKTAKANQNDTGKI